MSTEAAGRVAALPRATAFRTAAFAVALASVVLGLVGQSKARAQATTCETGAPFELGFGSGSTWTGCVAVDAVHGLEVTALAWRAPGNAARPVLAALHPASILVQREGESAASERLGAPGTAPAAADAAACAGESLDAGGHTVCARRTRSGPLSKYGDIAGVQGSSWWLESVLASDDGELWLGRVGLSETGRLEPRLALTGHSRGELVARVAWRMVFTLDGPAADRVEELDFELRPELGSRRPMRVRELGVETLRRAAPSSFRAWRVVDAGGASYLLDPQTAVAAPRGLGPNWTGFELALTARDDAERHAFAAPTLDGYVDGEPLAGSDPVLWHAVSMSVHPAAEDVPVLRERALGFALLPFDWTPASPFADAPR